MKVFGNGHVCVGENMYMHTMCTCALLQLDLCVTECSNKHSMYMYVYMILTCTMYITSSIFVLIAVGTSVIIPAANLLYCRFYIIITTSNHTFITVYAKLLKRQY